MRATNRFSLFVASRYYVNADADEGPAQDPREGPPILFNAD